MEGEGDEEEMVNGDRERDLGDEVKNQKRRASHQGQIKK